MSTLSEQLENTKNDNTKIGDTAPKERNLFDLVSQGNYTANDYSLLQQAQKRMTAPAVKYSFGDVLAAGFTDAAHEGGNTLQNVKIWGGQGVLSVGGITGSKTVENFGRSLINAANNEVQAKNKKYQQAYQPVIAPEDYNSFAYALGGGLFNYGEMLGLGYLTGGVGSVAGLSTKAAGALTETAGLGSMFAMELGGKAQDKINTYIEKSGDVDLKDYTADIASKDFMFSAMYASGSMIMEKKFGFGEQRKLFKMPFGQRLKNVAKIAVSEGGTELSQGLYEIGVDVAGGYLDFSKLPEAFMQAVQAGAVGGVLGGGAGIAAAIGHRSQAKAILREQLQNTVPEKDLDNVVDAIYEEADETARSVIAQELVQSEELRNKHGAIYEQIKDVINKQITDAGAYSDVEEAKKAQYIEGEASRFADEVLAEANKRGVTIDDVLTPNDIVYKDGRIYLKGLTEEQQKVRERKRRKKSREEVKPQEDELKAQIEENAPAEEKEQNLNDVVSSYEGAENYDVESMSTDEKQAVFEAEEAVKDSFTVQEENYDDIVRRLRYEDLTEEQEQELQEKLDKAEEKLKPLFDTAQDVALEIDEEFGLTLGDISDSISERRLNFKEAENLFGDYFPVNDLRELGEKIKERDNLRGDAVKIGYDYYTQRVYEAYDERIAREKNLSFEFSEREAKEDKQIDLTPETNEAIQENTLPEVEKEDTTTPDKIEDFGEKIEGARKDLWSGFKEKINKELPENAEDIKLSVVFPEPNYEKAIAEGVDVNALATIKALRDLIPTKPKYAYKLKQWRELVVTMRDIASRIINNNFDSSVIDKIMGETQFSKINNVVKLYQMLGYPYFTKAKGYTISPAYYHKYYRDEWTMTNIYHEGDKEGYGVEFNGRYIKVNGNYFFEDINDGVQEIKNRIDSEQQSNSRKVKFDIYYNTRDRSKVFLGKKVRSGKYLDLHTFSSVKEAREYLANNYDSLVEELNKLKQNPMDRGEVNEARVGEDYRRGSDVTPEMFADTFGFRGVQFGNWVEQKTRIKDLNEAYDALVDLSKVINVPTRALSLNGTLGLAFGARGHKGAMAHYEPDKVVINLTKMKGAGSLAHEWFHALDNSFMKKENKEYEYTSEWANDYNPLSHNRPEVMLAFMELRNALKKSKLMERSEKWDMWRSADYWSTIREMGARTFEQYIKDKLAEKEVSNDFLVNLISSEDEHNVYLNKDEKAEIYAAYDKLFNTLKTRETEKGVEFYQESLDIAEENARLDDIYPEYKGETITINGQEKTVYNSNGDRIAKSKEALENFYRWSEGAEPEKVENFDNINTSEEKTRVFEVYHGTRTHGIEEFESPYEDKLIFFTPNEQFAQDWGKNKWQDRDLYNKVEELVGDYRKQLNKESIEKYGEKWYNTDKSDEILREYKEKEKAYRQQVEEDLGVDAVVMPVYVKVHKVFDPEKDFEKVLPEIKEYYGFTDKQMEEQLPRIKKGSWIYFEHGNVVDKIYDLGYDGIILREIADGSKETIAVRPQKGNIKSVYNRGTYSESENIYYQGGKVKRGSFDALTKSIKITDKADFSTYAHEFAHYWLDNMWNYANSEMASQNYKDQFNEVKKWLGVKADQTYLTSAQHEKFARGYEKYLYTGNIPNPIIGDVFKDYNEFIKEVYESLEEVDTRAGKKYEPITPVMKEFFDSMITGKIEETEKPTEEAQEKPTAETKEVKPRGLAKTTAEMAEQKGIEVEKPTYEVRKQTKMAEKADEFIKENKQLAIDIVKGLAPEQDGIFREDLFAALRELALNEGDSDLLNDLSRSMTVEEATELGQRIQALARGRINPVKEMTELREERMKKNKVTKEKIKDETKKATKEIENEIALAAEPKEWQEFVKSLEC